MTAVADAMAKLAIDTMVMSLPLGAPIPMHLWGRDHYSTLAYLECRAIDNKGIIEPLHMRGARGVECDYPTRLACGVDLKPHNDWDCLDDIEAAGLIKNRGSGINPWIFMTEQGSIVAAALRAHKGTGGSFGNFKFGW